MTHVFSFNAPQKTVRQILIIPLLQMKKLSLREVKGRAQGHQEEEMRLSLSRFWRVLFCTAANLSPLPIFTEVKKKASQTKMSHSPLISRPEEAGASKLNQVVSFREAVLPCLLQGGGHRSLSASFQAWVA